MKEYCNKLRKVNVRKAQGSDEITPREMKIVAREISYSIVNISRISYESAKYPQNWKTGKVRVLYKGGDSDKCDNYRTLTMLSIPCKITDSPFFLNRVL